MLLTDHFLIHRPPPPIVVLQGLQRLSPVCGPLALLGAGSYAPSPWGSLTHTASLSNCNPSLNEPNI